MGLDIGFYTIYGDELLSFRNHHYLLEVFLAQPHETIEPYSDFYVTLHMLEHALAEIGDTQAAPFNALSNLPVNAEGNKGDVLAGIPDRFCDEEPRDLAAASPLYKTLLTRLQAILATQDVLICSWSA